MIEFVASNFLCGFCFAVFVYFTAYALPVIREFTKWK